MMLCTTRGVVVVMVDTLITRHVVIGVALLSGQSAASEMRGICDQSLLSCGVSGVPTMEMMPAAATSCVRHSPPSSRSVVVPSMTGCRRG